MLYDDAIRARRVVVAFVMLAVLAGAGGAPTAVGATADRPFTIKGGAGLQRSAQDGGGTYTSPTYGYSLSWDDEFWTIDEEGVENRRDVLVLRRRDTFGYLYVQGFQGHRGLPAPCLETATDDILDRPGYDDVTPADDADGDPIAGEEDDLAYAAYTFTYTDRDGDEIPQGAYFECHTLIEDRAVLTISYIGFGPTLADDVSFVREIDATLDTTNVGQDGLATPATRTRTTPPNGTGDGVDGDRYQSPSIGYILTWDEGVWTVVDADSSDAVDTLTLSNGTGLFTLNGAENAFADAGACFAAASRAIADREEVAGEVVVLEGDNGPLEAGNARNYYGFYGYTVTDDSGDDRDLYEYVECLVLPDAEAMLQLSFSAPIDQFEAENERFAELRRGLDVGAEADE